MLDDVIKERLEFLKLEYQQLGNHVHHLENIEWRIRQFSLTLWLVSLGVGLGVITEGVQPDFNILIISAAIPIIFLFFDAWNRHWRSQHNHRLTQIELFVSNRDYTLPSTGRKISFKQFCSSHKKPHEFPVLDFDGEATFGDDKTYKIMTGSALPHMIHGFRVLFYHFQLIASLAIIAMQSYKMHNNTKIFLIIGLSPLFHYSSALLSKIREARIQHRAE